MLLLFAGAQASAAGAPHRARAAAAPRRAHASLGPGRRRAGDEADAAAAHLDDHALRRRRHNALCAVLHEWARVELRATALRGNTPLAALGGALEAAMRRRAGRAAGAGIDASVRASLRGKARRPDLVALIPPAASAPDSISGTPPDSWPELLLVEVTVCRERALAERIAAKRDKYADATAALAAALAPHGVRVRGTLVVGLGERGAVPTGLRAELLRAAGASRCAQPEAAVDGLLSQLGAVVAAELRAGRGVAAVPGGGGRRRVAAAQSAAD